MPFIFYLKLHKEHDNDKFMEGGILKLKKDSFNLFVKEGFMKLEQIIFSFGILGGVSLLIWFMNLVLL